MRGLAAIARAIATRRRCPPDSSDGIRSMNSAETDEAQHLFDTGVGLVDRPIELLEELVADVLAHGERVEERALLKDHPEIGADRHQLVFVHAVDLFAVDEDPALIRLEQPENQAQDRRLSGAARAEEDLRVRGLQREADVAQDDLVVERQPDVVEDDDRPAGPEGLVEQRRTVARVFARHQYISTISNCVTR